MTRVNCDKAVTELTIKYERGMPQSKITDITNVTMRHITNTHNGGYNTQ